MLPVVDKPLIQYAVEEAYAAGVREMIFVTSRHKRAIEDHFDRTFELEDALEKSNKAELLAAVRAVKPDDMECVFVRQAAGARPRPRRAVRPPPRRRPSVRRAPARRPDDRHAAGAGADGRAVRGAPGSIIAVQEVPAEHTRRYGIVAGDAGRRPPGRHRPDRREARARGRAVAPRRRRPLRPDAARVRRDRRASRAASAARSSSPTASPGCCSTRRCSPTATRAGATTAAARKASCRPTSSSRSSTRSSAPDFRAYLRSLSL